MELGQSFKTTLKVGLTKKKYPSIKTTFQSGPLYSICAQCVTGVRKYKNLTIFVCTVIYWISLSYIYTYRSINQPTVETLYSTIYYSKYFIELNFDKSTQYVALWTHKRHPIPRPFGRAMECLLWVFHWNWPCYKGFLLYNIKVFMSFSKKSTLDIMHFFYTQ